MFNNYFMGCVGFTLIPIGKLHQKFTAQDISSYGIKNSLHHVRNVVGSVTLKGVYNISFTSSFIEQFIRI